MTKCLVVMDDVNKINPKKDSTLALCLAAQEVDWQIHICAINELSMRDGKVWVRHTPGVFYDDLNNWFVAQKENENLHVPVTDFDVILMRKDPPFDMNFVFCTYLLEWAQQAGVLVVNDPRALRDANEKLFTHWVPDCMPTTLVSAQTDELYNFVQTHKKTVIKPLHGMGGASVFVLNSDDVNRRSIIETLTNNGQQLVMAQKYLPEIRDGDVRVLLIDGEPAPFVVARVPAADDFRGNLAAGATATVRPINAVEKHIAQRVGPLCRERGLLLVGCDVIGDKLTEINVTSPTCLREIAREADYDVAAVLIKCLQQRLVSK